jgi:hypothetical protein
MSACAECTIRGQPCIVEQGDKFVVLAKPHEFRTEELEGTGEFYVSGS